MLNNNDNKEEKKEEKEKKVYRTYQHVIKKGHPLTLYFQEMMKSSNNLYNATNFHIRQVYSGLTRDESKPIHPLQQEVLGGLREAIPLINQHLQEKHSRLVAEDLCKQEIALSVDPKAEMKKRKLNQYDMPTPTKSFIGYNLLDAYFKHSQNVDYNSLPGQVNQQVMKNCYANWKGYFESLKDYKVAASKYTGRPKPPKYKPSGSMSGISFSNQICTIKKEKDGKQYLRFPKTNLTFNLSKHLTGKVAEQNMKLQQVRVMKWYDDVMLEIVLDCTKELIPLIPEKDIKNVMAIDLGVNNLAACVSNNGMQPFIINGKPLKSMNQYYNKRRSRIMADLRVGKQSNEGIYQSKRSKALDRKRSLKVKDYLHKATALIVNQVVENDIHKVIIGYNSSWKKDVEMRKKDKQTFIQIPFTMFINMLEYKLNALGIHMATHEESYTSQASFLDKDKIPTYGDKKIKPFSGKRIKRGLYRSKEGIVINADINGAANILRKHWHKRVNISHKLLSVVKVVNIKHARKPSSKKKGTKKETSLKEVIFTVHKKLVTPRKGIASRTANCVAGQITLWDTLGLA